MLHLKVFVGGIVGHGLRCAHTKILADKVIFRVPRQ